MTATVPSRIELVARWAYQFVMAERWKAHVGRPRAWEALITESKQFWLTEAENMLSRITPARAPPILGAEVGKVMFARCAACHTVFPAVRLPADSREFAAAAKTAHCPYCGGDKTLVSPHPLEFK